MNMLGAHYKQTGRFAFGFYINLLQKLQWFYKLNRFTITTNINIL